jgi:SAM-dependent methyltransferase
MMTFFPNLKVFSLRSFLWCFIAINLGSGGDRINAAFDFLDHKNLQLDLYLDLIRYNAQEKIGILPYILKKPNGIYLEIGTGGDPIAQMLSQIPSDAQTLLIASDIDESILNALPLRHPELKQYINSTVGPKLKLQKLNAIDMSVFGDSYLDGINASSVLHEIISYAGGFNGMEKFFKEAFRSLKPGGVLVYRDPENVCDKFSLVQVSLKNKAIRLFAHIFLYKFLDKKGSLLAQGGRKFELYKPESVIYRIYRKNEVRPIKLTYEQYLNVPSYDIDFSRRYVLTLPCGLYRELARHYITYLHQCNPLLFVKFTPDVISGCFVANYLAHSTVSIFNDFLVQKNWHINEGKIELRQKSEIDRHIAANLKVLEFGVPLYFSSKIKENLLREVLKKYGFEPGNHIIALNNGDCLLDYRVFGMLYDEITDQIFDRFNNVIEKKDEEQAKWLKREGEEFYFYYSADELITKVLELTLAEISNERGDRELYVLCPLSEKHSKFIDRLCYTELLNDALDVHDSLGYPIEVKDGKRIIHFGKMPLCDALDVCKKIVQENPLEYRCLQEMIDTLEKKYKC